MTTVSLPDAARLLDNVTNQLETGENSGPPTGNCEEWSWSQVLTLSPTADPASVQGKNAEDQDLSDLLKLSTETLSGFYEEDDNTRSR